MTAISYEYTVSKNPCAAKIIEDVAASEMTIKDILRIYDGKRTGEGHAITSVTFKIEMAAELGVEDKVALDNIVEASAGKHILTKTARTLLGELFEACADQAQQMRLLAALDKRPSFDRAIENQNFELAHTLKNMSFADGDIIQADVDLIDSIIPVSKWIDV